MERTLKIPCGKEQFLTRMPKLDADDSFTFSCHPGIPCFNECCADLNCALSPYDVVRLRDALSLGSREFIEQFATVQLLAPIGFPEVLLKMSDDERKSCPFVRVEGCSVYGDRPTACRYYPLAKGTLRGRDGSFSERFALVRENHCRGFRENKEYTPATWISDQELEVYDTYFTEYHKLITDLKAKGRTLNSNEFGITFLALFRIDDFFTFLASQGLMQKLKLPESEINDIVSNEGTGLAFAMGWLRNFLLS